MGLGGRAINYFITANLVGFNRAIRRADEDVDNFTGGLTDATKSVAVLTGALIGIGVVTGKIAKSSVDAFRPFRDEVALAAIASKGGIESIGSLQEQTLGLARAMKRMPQEMAETVRAISFFGIESKATENALAEVSTQLEELGGSKAEEGAKTMTTLLRSVGGESAVTEERVRALAGAMFQVGTNITSDIGGMQRFLQTFQSIGVVSKLNEIQIVALAGAIADLTPTQRDVATTAASRIFVSEQWEGIADLIGRTADEVKRLRKEDPVQYFQEVLESLRTAQEDDEFISKLTAAGFGELRSVRGTAPLIANLDKLTGPGGLLELVGDDVENLTLLKGAFDDKMGEGTGPLRDFKSSVGALGVRIGSILTPALNGLLTVLTKLVDLFNSPVGAMVLTAGIFGGAGLATKAIGGKLLSKLGLAASTSFTTTYAHSAVAAKKKLMQGGRGVMRGAGETPLPKGSLSSRAGALLGGGLEKAFAGLHGRAAAGGMRGLMAGGALRTMGMLANPITQTILALSMLAPILGGLGKWFSEMADQGGILGGAFRALAISLKTVALIGETINFLFRKLGDGIKWLGEKIKGFLDKTGLSAVVDFFKDVGDTIEGWVDTAREFVTPPVDASGITGPVQRGGGDTFNISTQSQDAQANYVQRALLLRGA